jgi:hypothetical protein
MDFYQRSKQTNKQTNKQANGCLTHGWLMHYLFFLFSRGKRFWRRGLKCVWGDPKKVLDGDVVRFQWPSIGSGWEDGLLRFASAMITQRSKMTDTELVEQVLQSNAVITVVLGTKDKVVCSRAVKRFLAPYKDRVRIEEMKGLGHDPFEENVPGFVDLVERLLQEDKERILGL